MDYEEFEIYGTDWEAGGYFECPRPNSNNLSDWTTYLECLDQAKNGRFSEVSKLEKVVTTTTDPVLQSVCIELLGDAAPSDSFKEMRQYISEKGWVDRQLHFSHALSVQGCLANVLPMLSIYVREHDYKDASFVPVHISRILGKVVSCDPKEEFENVGEYADLVALEAERIGAHFGTEDVLLYQGELLSVGTIVTEFKMGDTTPWWLRRRFEAMTGIDCSCFYKEEIFQPLSANAVLEEFAESSAFAKFTPGLRYFFGWPIP